MNFTQCNNNKINWELIFNLDEFRILLNTDKLKKIYSLNKKLNSNFKPITFNHINIINVSLYLDDVGETEFENSDDDEETKLELRKRAVNREVEKARAINNYSEYFENFKYFVQFITIRECATKLLVKQIPHTFINLQGLILIDMVFDYSGFNSLLRSLPKLKTLKLENCLITKDGEYNLETFEFPNSLEHLSVKRWRISNIHTAKELGYIPYDRLYDNLEGHLDEFDFFNVKSNLISFIYLDTDEAYAENIAQFLQLNIALQALTVDIYFFDYDLFQAINQSNLTKLTILSNNAVDEDKNEIEIPQLSKIAYLDLTSLAAENYLFERNLIESCPNLKTLKS